MVQLIIVAGLRLIIGYKRERRNQSASLRIYKVLVTGSVLAMIVSIDIAMEYRGIATNGDPAGLAACSARNLRHWLSRGGCHFAVWLEYQRTDYGIFYLDHGRSRSFFGEGYFAAGVSTAFIPFVILAKVNVPEERRILSYNIRYHIVEADDRRGLIAQIKALLKRLKRNLKTFEFDRNFGEHIVMLDLVLHIFKIKVLGGLLWSWLILKVYAELGLAWELT